MLWNNYTLKTLIQMLLKLKIKWNLLKVRKIFYNKNNKIHQWVLLKYQRILK